jgi:hypothetical protein
MRTEMDFLVIDRLLFKKEDQTPWDKDEDWRSLYELD